MVNVSFCCSNLSYICLSLEENEKKNGIERRRREGEDEAGEAKGGGEGEEEAPMGSSKKRKRERERGRLGRVMGVKR